MEDVKVIDHTDEVMSAIRRGSLAGLTAAGFMVQAEGMDNIRTNEQIDTGSMLNGLAVITPDMDQREQVAMAAVAKAKEGGEEGHRATPGKPPEPDEVKVVEVMAHGVYQEMGWMGVAKIDGELYGQAGMHGRPYLGPAAESVRKKVPEVVEQHVAAELKKHKS